MLCMNVSARIKSLATAPSSLLPIAYLRILFGLTLFTEAIRHFAHGWIEAIYILPPLHFPYPGFHWLEPLPGIGMYLVFAALAVLGLVVALGWKTRFTLPLLTLTYLYIFLLEQSTYNNHYYFYLLIGFVLILLPSGKLLSLDARKHGASRISTVERWNLWLIQFTLALPYVFGGVAKLNSDWLFAQQPVRIWIADYSGTLLQPFFSLAWAPHILSWGGTLLDLFIVPALMWKKTRWAAVIVALVFHTTNSFWFTIGLFPFVMILITPIFFDASWWEKLHKRYVPQSNKLLHSKPFIRWVAIVFVCVQLLLPFRHHLIAGNVYWNMMGGRFSWLMKSTDKKGSMNIFVRDPASGDELPIDAADYLTPLQLRVVAKHPTMLLDFAQHLTSFIQTPSGATPIIRAEIEFAFNGRESQYLIDPDVDLLSITPQTPLEDWILPLSSKFTEK